jgi:hypothetical protein
MSCGLLSYKKVTKQEAAFFAVAAIPSTGLDGRLPGREATGGTRAGPVIVNGLLYQP